jgi:hypothetical protein
MSDTILSVLQHALGVDQFGSGVQYRNHFVSGTGHDSYDACCAAVDQGLMTRRESQMLGDNGSYFHATDAGKRWMVDNSPHPPKLTRSQRRYQRYIDADSSMSFHKWLKSSWSRDDAADLSGRKPEWTGFDPALDDAVPF